MIVRFMWFEQCNVELRVGCIDGYSWGNTVMSYNTYMYCTIYMGKINICTNYIGFFKE